MTWKGLFSLPSVNHLFHYVLEQDLTYIEVWM